jgi:hypothetical protein
MTHEKIKTFEDACAKLGIKPEEVLVNISNLGEDGIAVRAFHKALIICKALNEGWKPDWNDSNQYKYYPWFDMDSSSGFSFYGYGYDFSYSRLGSRLCFKSREIAIYAGKQFENNYKEFFTF